MDRQNISGESPFEPIYGFSRAVRVGKTVYVSGTGSIGRDGKAAHPGDAYAQTIDVFQKIETVLKEAGASLSDVVRTRIFCAEIRDFEAITKAHGELFGEIRPAASLIEVSGFVLPEMLVEIEVDAEIS
jgi:enamine deaminase RidA (YjgF/YER057c/UK114 family)